MCEKCVERYPLSAGPVDCGCTMILHKRSEGQAKEDHLAYCVPCDEHLVEMLENEAGFDMELFFNEGVGSVAEEWGW